MLERDLQDYLFDNPEVLFPNQKIASKRREVYVEGRRIDLLFEVDGIHYIIELKRDTIKREHIGQIFEYYGLMRQSNSTIKYRMILVAPSIPAYRRIPLEEFGIRCVEVPYRAESIREQAVAVHDAVKHVKPERPDLSARIEPTRLHFDDFSTPVTPASVQLSHQVLRDGLPIIQKAFSEYEVLPVRMANSKASDILCFAATSTNTETTWNAGGIWWAYSFGHSDEMPKNDVPNISVMKFPWGLDLTVNAELQTSQRVMLKGIASSTGHFDQLVDQHGSLQLQTWFKLEYQPRMYHWILLAHKAQATWHGQDILDLYQECEGNFERLKAGWLDAIVHSRPQLTEGQIQHMRRTNKKLNLAIRLVHSFPKEAALWDLPYDQQTATLAAEGCRMKPLIDFFH